LHPRRAACVERRSELAGTHIKRREPERCGTERPTSPRWLLCAQGCSGRSERTIAHRVPSRCRERCFRNFPEGRLACEAWNKRMLGSRGPSQPSPTLWGRVERRILLSRGVLVATRTRPLRSMWSAGRRQDRSTSLADDEIYFRFRRHSGLDWNCCPRGSVANDQNRTCPERLLMAIGIIFERATYWYALRAPDRL
jgi:hypothetical protein